MLTILSQPHVLLCCAAAFAATALLARHASRICAPLGLIDRRAGALAPDRVVHGHRAVAEDDQRRPVEPRRRIGRSVARPQLGELLAQRPLARVCGGELRPARSLLRPAEAVEDLQLRRCQREPPVLVLAVEGQQRAPELGEIVRRSFDERWIDAPVRPGKRGGAFCAYTVPSVHPYVMLNFTAKRRDVLTLAHELGHGIHFALAAKQGILQQHTPLTVAETASVFGEAIVFGRLLEAAETPESRLALLADAIEGAIATVFRQTAMNRFEHGVHTARREEGELSVERFGATPVPELETSANAIFQEYCAVRAEVGGEERDGGGGQHADVYDVDAGTGEARHDRGREELARGARVAAHDRRRPMPLERADITEDVGRRHRQVERELGRRARPDPPLEHGERA